MSSSVPGLLIFAGNNAQRCTKDLTHGAIVGSGRKTLPTLWSAEAAQARAILPPSGLLRVLYRIVDEKNVRGRRADYFEIVDHEGFHWASPFNA
jgi:hypothetical protein